MKSMQTSIASAGLTIGRIIRSRRVSRGKSQLHLALDAGISSRHLSFVETGRSNPSREMVVTLAEALEVPLRERNVWLEAAGYAALYRETPLDSPSMSEIRVALGYILDAHGPNPAFAFNRRYDIVMRNDAARRLLSFFAPEWRGPDNLLEMLLFRDGLRDSVEHWAERAAYGIDHVKRELSGTPNDASDEAFLRRLVAAERELPPSGKGAGVPSSAIVVPMRLRRAGTYVEFFTAVTTLGTPLDITLQELRIETYFPATASSRDAFQVILESEP
jgi:transcriptional regulator with XRE-family HTH domain